MFSKLSSIQKYGLGIVVLCMLWILVTKSQRNVTLENLTVINGKITDIQIERVGKYLNDTALSCTLSDGHVFYANHYLHKMSDRAFADTLRNARNVKLWVEQDASLYKIVEPYQLVADDVVYVDFYKNHTDRPDYFWFVVGGFLLGVAFILVPFMKSISGIRKS